MTIAELEKKVAAAEEKVSKCHKTIERHIAQMEKKGKQLRDMGIDPETADKYDYAHGRSQKEDEAYWLLCDYEYKKDDIKGAQKKLQEAQRICDNWKQKLDLQINIQKVISNEVPQIIKDFLQDWKEKTFQWYVKRHGLFVERKAELKEQVRQAKIEGLRTLPEYAELRERVGDRLYEDSYYINNVWPRKPMEAFLKECDLDDKSVKRALSFISDGTIAKMCEFHCEDDRTAWLDAHLEDAKREKLLWFYTNVTNITGPIKDAKNLYISAGDLNGVVIGEKGAAKVQTFSAGGWNVQCFHFRTRIDDVTEKYISTGKKQDLSAIIQSAEIKQLRVTKKQPLHSVELEH